MHLLGLAVLLHAISDDGPRRGAPPSRDDDDGSDPLRGVAPVRRCATRGRARSAFVTRPVGRAGRGIGHAVLVAQTRTRAARPCARAPERRAPHLALGSGAMASRRPGPVRTREIPPAVAIRSELQRLRAGLDRIEEALSSLDNPERPPGRERPRPERYLQVLVAVYDEGGRHGLDAATFARLGGRYGYDPRGLGGFFAGARAPLHRVDGRVRLTAEGERLVDRYLDERLAG